MRSIPQTFFKPLYPLFRGIGQWTIKTTDIKSAFLQGVPILRDIFIQPPAESTTLPGMIWKLRRCLYGLNNAARQFYESAHTTLLKLGCSQ